MEQDKQSEDLLRAELRALLAEDANTYNIKVGAVRDVAERLMKVGIRRLGEGRLVMEAGGTVGDFVRDAIGRQAPHLFRGRSDDDAPNPAPAVPSGPKPKGPPMTATEKLNRANGTNW